MRSVIAAALLQLKFLRALPQSVISRFISVPHLPALLSMKDFLQSVTMHSEKAQGKAWSPGAGLAFRAASVTKFGPK